MKGKFWRKALAAALALLIVSGGVPMQPFTQIPESTVITANAAEYTQNPTTKDELVPLASSSSVSEAHVVKYANKEWYVIGYDGVGLASESGTMTLLLKGTLGRREFSDNYSNVYADSSIHSYLESYLANTDNFTSDESGAVVARTLSGGGSTGNSYSGHVSGDSVDAKLWLLSAAEARKIPQSIIKSGGDGNGWWLRSPGNSSSNANYIPVSPPDMNDYPKESGADVLYDKYIRPAMLLDLDSVIYSSETNTLIAQEAEAHGITVSLDNEQGSVEAPSRADKGETVRFTITPAVGYAVDTVTFNDISLSPVNGEYSFTMPNSDVTISVTFNQIYKVEDHLEQDGDTYTIKTAKGWEVFCDCVKSGAYNGFWNKTVKLGLDITDGVTVSAGIPGKPFYGTFDGCGHTLAVALNSTDEEWVAPFSFFSGSIKNLTVTGTVTGSTYAGGLTGFTYGGSIENVTVSADVSGSSKIGGITGYCDFGSLLIKNTIFNGSLQCEGDINGLIGWASENVGYNQAITIENCLFNGEYTCDGEFHPITIRNSNSQFKYTDNGAYYTVDPNLSSNSYIICAGTHVSTIAADDDLTITANPTCKFNSVDYYAEGTAVTVSSDESITGVLVNNGSVEVTDNQDGTYSFAMPAENVTINAIFTHSICINNTIQHGSVTANIGTTENVTAAPAGDTVTLTVTPDAGYEVKSVSVNGEAITYVDGVYSFTMPARDVSVSAVFEPITYSVAFDKNSDDATGTMANQSFIYDEAEKTLTANTFERTGYTFAGWNTEADGSGTTYADKAEVSNLTAENNEVVTLYAQWEVNNYTVHFDVNNDNAYGEMTDQNFTYGEKQTLTVNTYGSTTGEFIKWNTEPDGSGTDYADGAEVQNLTAENGGTVTLYAQWHKMYLFNYDDSIFSCHVVGKENEKYWAYPGDTVQLNITDDTHEYTIAVKGEDGTDIAFDTSTNTFVMPDQPVKITATSVKKIDNTSILLDSFEAWDDVSYVYDENDPTVTPIVTVKDGETTLTEGTDYTLSITNNTGKSDEVVTAIVTITGKGDYVGTNTKEFRITPFNIANCELKGKLEAYDDGYGVYYPLVNNVQVWNGDTQLESGTDYSLDIEYADSYEVGQTYTATIKGTGTWGGTKTFTFTVVELSHTVVFDSNGGTGTMASDVATKGQHYDLPECTFTAPYGYEFDYWEVSCEEGVEKQPGNYFTAPYIWSESDVQTITVTAHWKEKAKYSITLPDEMEIVSGVVTDGKAYKDETVTFKVKNGYTASNVMANDTALTADEYGVYTVNVDGDVTVSAEFNYVVIINSVDINGTATPTTVYVETFTAADYTVPSAPYLDGYDFKGWTVNDTLYTTADEVQTAVGTLVTGKTAVTVAVVYEKKADKFDVSVTDGTLSGGKTSDNIQVSTLVTVKADTKAGKKFSHWLKNGVKASSNASYTFYMPSSDVTLEAVFVDEEVEVEQVGTALIESVTPNKSTGKVAFVSVVNVPKNCTMVKGGLVATSNSTIGANVDDTNAMFIKISNKTTASTKNLKYTWTKSGVTESTVWYVRSYLVYKDSKGVEHTVYSNAVKANINGIIND